MDDDDCDYCRGDDWETCISGTWYGPCSSEDCYGVCEWAGKCPCVECHAEAVE